MDQEFLSHSLCLSVALPELQSSQPRLLGLLKLGLRTMSLVMDLPLFNPQWPEKPSNANEDTNLGQLSNNYLGVHWFAVARWISVWQDSWGAPWQRGVCPQSIAFVDGVEGVGHGNAEEVCCIGTAMTTAELIFQNSKGTSLMSIIEMVRLSPLWG